MEDYSIDMSLFFCSLCVYVVCVCMYVCIYLCVEIFFIVCQQTLWPMHTPQAVSTAVELLNSGPACSDYSTTHTHTHTHTHTLKVVF